MTVGGDSCSQRLCVDTTEPVYHYTSPAGLLGLVEHHELWASEAAAMNDVAEVRQGWRFIRDWVSRQKGGRRTRGVLELIASHAEMSEADESPLGYLGTSPEGIYICCASTRVDDANQWRLYGAEGRGYAVELNPLVNLRATVSGERPPAVVDSYVDDEGRAHSFVLPSDTVDVSPWLHVLYADEEKSEALAGLVDAASAELVLRRSEPDPDRMMVSTTAHMRTCSRSSVRTSRGLLS